LYEFFAHVRRDVIDFVVEKYEGEVVDRICEVVMD
jgi:hypothetical protein